MVKKRKRRKKPRRKGQGKGPNFERKICVLLSEWWTDGNRDDIFWRSTTSGGRATFRGSKGKKTTGQYGDVAAISNKGRALLRVATIELKNGYPKETLANLLDNAHAHVIPVFRSWIDQAEESASLARSRWWMIIHQRTRRSAVVYMPGDMFQNLHWRGCFTPQVNAIVYHESPTSRIIGIRLNDFLRCVSAEDIRGLVKKKPKPQIKLKPKLKLKLRRKK